MIRKKLLEKILLSVSVIILLLLVVIMLMKVTDFQGDARVINYAGRARGATQKLVKQELSGYENNELIDRLDSILNELYTGIGDNNLIVINDKNYLNKLELQIEAWNELKEEIYIARENTSNKDNLYALSELYYEISDDTVDAAENYSAGQALIIKNLEYFIAVISIVILITIIVLINNLVYLARLNKKLNQVAYIDILTGLPNRSKCEIKLAEIGMNRRARNISCLMFDLNNLKTTNDSMGHQAGDNLIIAFAGILRSSAPDRMFIGRYGGDEFIGIIKDTTENEIHLFIKTLNDNIEKHNQNTNNIEISLAYGYAISSNYDHITINELLDQADINMYKLKSIMKAE